jgi:hypothetical protein
MVSVKLVRKLQELSESIAVISCAYHARSVVLPKIFRLTMTISVARGAVHVVTVLEELYAITVIVPCALV